MAGCAPRHWRERAKKVREVDFSSENRKSHARHTSHKYFLDAKISASSGFSRGENIFRAKNKNRASACVRRRKHEAAKQQNQRGSSDFPRENRSMEGPRPCGPWMRGGETRPPAGLVRRAKTMRAKKPDGCAHILKARPEAALHLWAPPELTQRKRRLRCRSRLESGI